MALSKDGNAKFVIIEFAGMDNEHILHRKFDTLSDANRRLKRDYSVEDIEEMNVRISLQLPDGSISTEF